MDSTNPHPAETAANLTERAEKLLRRLRRDTLGYLTQADVLDDLLSALGSLDEAARKTERDDMAGARMFLAIAVENYCDDIESDIADGFDSAPVAAAGGAL